MTENTTTGIAISDVIAIARSAGRAIKAIYDTADFSVEVKRDNSPLTTADTRAHAIIVSQLQKLTPNIPIVSEEGHLPTWQERRQYMDYWLIDPLDGTKEFIKRNGEFTVNIALISNHTPVLGVVYAPVKDQLYYGEVSEKVKKEAKSEVNGEGKGGLKEEENSEIDKRAYKQSGDSSPVPITVAQLPAENDCWTIVGSRSHPSEEFQAFIQQFPRRQLVSMGSSLKLCLVAEGKAHLYPRLGLTSEWDTAAAHAIIAAAGGEVFDYDTRHVLRYNTKESLLNSHFIACACTRYPLPLDKARDKTQTNNIVWQTVSVNKARRVSRGKQKPVIIWFTGLSGSGKSTTASALEERLFSMGYSTYLLDGDNIRHGLCSDLRFGDQDRIENIRRVGEVAKLFVDAGIIVITAFISPFIQEREMVRAIVEPDEFIEVYMNTPLAECEKRDPKGLYKKARAGEIKNFTGIDSPYEAPQNPECEVSTTTTSVEGAVNQLIDRLAFLGVLN